MKGLIESLNPYLWLIKIVAIAAAVVGAWWWEAPNDAEQKIGYGRCAGEYAVKLAEAKDEALTIERWWDAKWKGAVNERTEDEKRLADARAASAAADQRLRNATDDFRLRLSEATLEASRSAAITAAGLLDECSTEYRRVAASADGHLADLKQCEAAWPE